MNTMDADVERFLKLLTLLDFDTIAGIVNNHIQNPELRFGQKQLANYVITTVYGADAAEQAQKITEILFSDDKMSTIKTLKAKDIDALMREVG
jgi:tyrosyl-tRNA synthetase